jgi:hypothetical protein
VADIRARVRLLAAMTVIAVTPAVAVAQGGSAGSTTSTLPSRCASLVSTLPGVTDKARIEAQQIAGRAQAASINGDNAAATQLYESAAQLDPTDPGIAYVLGREYEATHDARAMNEYCRFLALNPAAPEAADVRQRIADLSLALPPDTTVVRIPAAASRMPSPGSALVAGLIIPGLGQFMTHHTTSGLLVMAGTAGAIAWGLQSSTTTHLVTRNAVDPLGHPYQYQTPVTVTERPHAAVGFGIAATIAVMGALDAFTRARASRDAEPARSADSPPPHSARPVLAFAPRSVGIGLTIQ